MSHLYSEVVKIVDFGPYVVHKPKGADPLNFRVEIIFRRNRQFFAGIYHEKPFLFNRRSLYQKASPLENNWGTSRSTLWTIFSRQLSLKAKVQMRLLKKLKMLLSGCLVFAD